MPWDSITVSEDYKGCENCKHTDKECNEFPCINCNHTFVDGTPEFDEHPFLWESPNTNQVNHPSHYNQGNIECLDAMESAFGKEAVATWCKLNAFKYIWREQHKNGMEDIDKAIFYLNKFKELKANA